MILHCINKMGKSNRIKKREMKTRLSLLMALPCGALVPSSTSWFQQKTLPSYILTTIILSNLITIPITLFPADNHGSPDPLRDSPERFPLGTSQASPGPNNLRICAAFTLPRAKKWREGVG